MRQCSRCGSTFDDDSMVRCPGDDAPTIAVARATGIPTGSMDEDDFDGGGGRGHAPTPPPQQQLAPGYAMPGYGQPNPYAWAQPSMVAQPMYAWGQPGVYPQQVPQGWTPQPQQGQPGMYAPQQPWTPPPAATPAPDAYAYAAQGARTPESFLGKTIGNFKLTRLLGAGGMGAVFEGVHPIVGNRVAVKLMGISGQVDRDLIDRFFREAQVLNQVAHDNIVKVVDLGQHNDGFYYCVMEFLDGESLAAALATRMKLGRVLRICAAVADALAAAHARGIVHRDLKPANVMLVKGPNGAEVVKLVDFGIAKTQSQGQTNQTQTGTVIGTPAYMAPEQAAGRVGEVDHRSDLYALGIMLYEMATGKHPWAGRAPGEVIAAQISEMPKPPSRVVPIAPALDGLIMRLLEKKRDLRPADAATVARALRDLLNELENAPGTQPMMAPVSRPTQPALRPVSPATGQAQTIANRPAAAPAPTSVSRPGSPGLAPAPPSPSAPPTPAARAPMAMPAPRKKSSPLRWVLPLTLVAAVGVGAAVYAGRVNVDPMVAQVATSLGNVPESTGAAQGANTKLDGLKGTFAAAPAVKACQSELDQFRDIGAPATTDDTLEKLGAKVGRLETLATCLTNIMPSMPPEQLWAAAYVEGVANMEVTRLLRGLAGPLSDTARTYRTADGVARYWHELYSNVASDRFRRAREGAPETNRAFIDGFLRELGG